MKRKSEQLPLRCTWARSELMIRYHDEEWGVPVHEDNKLFEFLILEGAQAGLSWETILNKRENYRAAFDGFDPERIARYDGRKMAQLLRNPGIVRNRLKIGSAVGNAQALLRLRKEYGSFNSYVWQFVNGKPRVNLWEAAGSSSGTHPRVRCPEQGSEKARLQFCGIDYLLCLHAGRWNGQRSRDAVLPAQSHSQYNWIWRSSKLKITTRAGMAELADAADSKADAAYILSVSK